VKLASGERVWVVDCLDDHARFLLAALACRRPTGKAAWTCLLAASSAHGLPRQLLSDNHTSFTGRLFGFESAFERKLGEIGVELINAAPAHPQTLGKLERFHRTLKEWLEDEGPALDLEHLQLLLDRFRSHYNTERPHQGIDDLTPTERYLPGSAPSAPLGELALAEQEKQPAYPPYSLTRKVWANGIVAFEGLGITLGRRYAGATVRIVEVGELIHVYLGDELLRSLAPDRERRYQRLNTGRRRRRS
jgi:Integrase core domain